MHAGFGVASIRDARSKRALLLSLVQLGAAEIRQVLCGRPKSSMVVSGISGRPQTLLEGELLVDPRARSSTKLRSPLFPIYPRFPQPLKSSSSIPSLPQTPSSTHEPFRLFSAHLKTACSAHPPPLLPPPPTQPPPLPPPPPPMASAHPPPRPRASSKRRPTSSTSRSPPPPCQA